MSHEHEQSTEGQYLAIPIDTRDGNNRKTFLRLRMFSTDFPAHGLWHSPIYKGHYDPV